MDYRKCYIAFSVYFALGGWPFMSLCAAERLIMNSRVIKD